MKAGIDWSKKRGSAHTLPETEMFLSSADRESETLSLLWIDDKAVSDYVCAVDILHTIFSMQLSGHSNTSFLHIASYYFPIAGLLHLTRVQLKTRSCRTPGLFFSSRGRGHEAMVSRRKECSMTHSIALQSYDRNQKSVHHINRNW